MNGYTSGKATHDPMPWTSASGTRFAYPMSTQPIVGLRFAPRREYDNHNPILADYRENHDEDWDRNDPNYADVSTAGYLAEIDDLTWGSEWHTNLQRAWKDHARRVLTKLAALGEAS